MPTRSNRGLVQGSRSASSLAGALALVLVVAGCSSCKQSSSGTSTDAAAPPSSASGLTPEQASKVLARVGDRTIRLGDFAATLEHMDQFDRMRYQAPERRKELLGEMINVMLLADEARDKHYDQDPQTDQEIRQVLRDALLKQAHEGLGGPSDITADQVRAYYDAHKADFHDPERRRVSAIVLPTAGAANDVLSTLKSGGTAKWGDLVRSKSVDPRAKSNVPVDLAGDFGFVSPPGDPRGGNPNVPDEVRSAVFGLGAVGDYTTSPVPAAGKYWIVRLSGRTDPHDRSIDDAEKTIRVKLAQDKIHAAEEELVDKLRAKFPVKVDEAALATVKVDLPAVDAGADAR
jgi:DNA-directed RNA polymerase subunit F